jgi:hypothetical protein
MPPPKKAAKKAAKHASRHADPKHRESKDLRRSFEHLGRIEALHSTAALAQDVGLLVTFARQQLKDGDASNAAEFLRAAEHLSFASLASQNAIPIKVSGATEQAIEDEFQHLSRKAEEHWDPRGANSQIAAIYDATLDNAQRAFKKSSFHVAMESIRAAEALARVEPLGPTRLSAPGSLKLRT